MPTGAGSLQGRKSPISTGLCDSGEFSTTIRDHSPARFFDYSGSLPARFFDYSGSPYK